MRAAHNLRLLTEGAAYGLLTVLKDAPGADPLFECACGVVCSKNRSAVRQGFTKSCGCLHRAHAFELGLSRAKQLGLSEAVVDYGSYVRRARKKALTWKITFDEFVELVQQPCFYCGNPPSMGHVFKHNGIDRYDSSKGYDAGNAVSCCSICNRAKSNLLPSEFEQWIERVQGDNHPYRPSGYVAISKIVDSAGKLVSWEQAVKNGWLSNEYRTDEISKFKAKESAYSEEFPNLFVDQGRQLLAYCFAFRSPIQNFVCSKFGVGTGSTAAKASDVALEAPVALATGNLLASTDSIDFLSAFVVRVAFTLGLADCNGSLIREEGLFSGNDSLIARRVRTVGINKTSDFAPTLTWRIRF